MKKQSDNAQPATKADIRAQRNEFKRTEKFLRAESLGLEERLEKVEDILKGVKETVENTNKTIETTNKKIDKLTNTVVNFVGRVVTLEDENVVGSHQMRKLDVRVTKLESKLHTT